MNKFFRIGLFLAVIIVSITISLFSLQFFIVEFYDGASSRLTSKLTGMIFLYMSWGIALLPIPCILIGIALSIIKDFKTGIFITLTPAAYALAMLCLLFTLKTSGTLTN